MIPIIPFGLNVTFNSNVCTVCSSTYNDINDFFLRMTQQKSNAGICMDIVDTVRSIHFSKLFFIYNIKDELYSITMEYNLSMSTAQSGLYGCYWNIIFYSNYCFGFLC